jgi:hypothetical protein
MIEVLILVYVQKDLQRGYGEGKRSATLVWNGTRKAKLNIIILSQKGEIHT